MQSASDDTGVTLQKRSPLSDVDFGVGEPYLDDGEDVDYVKRLKQLEERQSRLAAAKMEETENEYDNTNAVFPSTSKEGQPPSLKEDEEEGEEGEEDEEEEEEEEEREKDSLEDDDKSESSGSGTSDQASECGSLEHGKKETKPQTVSERLSRDAMSLKRHQLQEPRQSRRERDRGRPSDRKSSRFEGKRSPRNKSKRDESQRRIGDPRKSFKASHELYGEEYPNKFHLPPRSPTFSFRSTIDLLPSTHRKQGLRQQIIVTFSCCLGPLACGFAMAYILAIHPGIILGVDIGVWETYAFFMGCIGGGFFSGLLVNLGRKMTLLLTMTPYALSWLMVIFATEVWMLLAFHATAGACTGLTLVLAQVYVAEVATPGVRGAISCGPLLAFQIGSLLCYSLGNVLAWRHLAAVGMGITLPFFFAVVLCMPESPRFLVHVRPNDALATLQWLRGFEGDVMDEYRDIADSSETDRWSIDLDDLSRPTFWRPLVLSCGLMFFYNMTGLASFGLYGMELFADVSYHPVNVAYYINTTIVVVGIVIASILVDQIGRKLVLLLSITIMAASAFTIGLFMFLKDYNKVESYFEYQWAAEVFCVVLFTFAHGVGMSPIAWITMGEVFGPRHKWIGVTFSSMVFWASMIAVDLVFQYLRYTVLTGGIFWFHCVMCVAGYIFVLLCFRELKEQRIDDITKSFTKKHDSLMDTFIARA